MDISDSRNGITYHPDQFLFFPFEFTFLPSINTKMAMAGIGLVILIIQLACGRKSVIDRDFFNFR